MNYKYVLIKSSELSAEEIETKEQGIELTILWSDDYILYSGVVKDFTIGESNCDYIMPKEKLGMSQHTLIKDGIFYTPNPVVITEKISQAVFGDFVFRTKLINKGKKYSTSIFKDLQKYVYTGLSAVAHVSLLSMIAFFLPPLGLSDAEAMEKDQLYLMQQYLTASAEREQDAKEEANTQDDDGKSSEEGVGVRAAGSEGSMGNPLSKQSNKSYSIAGPSDNKDIHIAREAMRNAASSFGIIGILNEGSQGGGEVVSPWGDVDSLGKNPANFNGNLWGGDFGESYGSGGLGLSSVGEGGGNTIGNGLIGLGSIGTIGGGFGNSGFGSSHGKLNGTHKPTSPKVRIGTTTINGRIDPTILQRIIRQNFGRFRFCYEGALKGNPSLSGRISVRFIIDARGGVSSVSSSGGTDLPDPNVVRCVTSAFYSLSFPESVDGKGIITVVYPIVFSPQ